MEMDLHGKGQFGEKKKEERRNERKRDNKEGIEKDIKI